jgi:phospholipase/carboxylesterase
MEPLPLFYKAAPLSANESNSLPLLMLLHGRGTDENDLLGLTQSFDPHLLVISVRAPFKFPYGGYTWFDLDDTDAVNIDQLINSRNSIFQCLDDIQLKYQIDPARIFLFGFSMGAMMSLAVSLSNPKRFKGIIAHSGLLLQDERLSYQWDDLSDISFFIAHGQYDPIVPIELGRQAYSRLIKANAKVIFREYSIQHTISEESLSDAATWLQQRI